MKLHMFGVTLVKLRTGLLVTVALSLSILSSLITVHPAGALSLGLDSAVRPVVDPVLNILQPVTSLLRQSSPRPLLVQTPEPILAPAMVSDTDQSLKSDMVDAETSPTQTPLVSSQAGTASLKESNELPNQVVLQPLPIMVDKIDMQLAAMPQPVSVLVSTEQSDVSTSATGGIVQTTTHGWKFFGITWYWWLLILAALVGAWILIASVIRRLHKEPV